MLWLSLSVIPRLFRFRGLTFVKVTMLHRAEITLGSRADWDAQAGLSRCSRTVLGGGRAPCGVLQGSLGGASHVRTGTVASRCSDDFKLLSIGVRLVVRRLLLRLVVMFLRTG